MAELTHLDERGQAKIAVDHDKLADYCRRWKIVELAFFGSALREDFRPDSDVDVLVSFTPGVHWRLFDLVEMEHELSVLLGRDVDLVERPAVEASENYIRRKHILANLETIYAAP